LMALLPLAAAGQVDLAERYPDRTQPADTYQPMAASCDADDVYRIDRWRVDMGHELSIECGASTLAVGAGDLGATWAVIMPDEPARISAPGVAGALEVVYLRFHPSWIGSMFPADTVTGPGPETATTWAQRNYLWRIQNSFHSGWLPTIPAPKDIVLDLDTTAGTRRFYVLDTEAGSVRYVDQFEAQPLPALIPVTPEEAEDIFAHTVEAFETRYAMFGIKDFVDWQTLVSEHRGAAAEQATSYQVAAILADMLSELRDMHIGVSVGPETIPVYQPERLLNGSLEGIQTMIGDLSSPGAGLTVGRTEDGLGYLLIGSLGDSRLTEPFDEALAQMRDAPGLIIDVRFNGGGNEALGQQIAGRFVSEPSVYAMHQYRAGPGLTELADPQQRVLQPRGPWTYQRPLVVLQGEITMSSAEAFVLMLRQAPNVTTMGAPTAGSSGNPEDVQMGGGVVVRVPRWLALTPNGQPFEGEGIPPDIPVPVTADELAGGSDPVLARAIEEMSGG
ncbi:MAG: hypothetical protein GF320_08115, partial [Armatimonadia bacterium]|nr:hypothetical protein [Armatimonadia bacterium]